jgi:ElaB/YqjD/DUF883 family membrane-anchored ribosome-binding protein
MTKSISDGLLNSNSTRPDYVKKFAGDSILKINALASNAAHSASSYSSEAQNYVRENPLKSVTGAALIGAVIGQVLMMVSRRR